MRITYLMPDVSIRLDEGDGATLHVFHIIDSLLALAHDVKLLAATVPPVPLIDRQVHWVRALHPWSDGSFPLVEAANTARVARQFTWDADVIHERFSAFNRAGAQVTRERSIPLVLEVNAPLLEERQSQWKLGPKAVETMRQSTHASFDAASRILVPCRQLADILASRWSVARSKLAVVPNAVDVARFANPLQPDELGSVRRAFGLGEGPLGLFVGSLKPWHGVDLLVDAHSTVFRACPDYRLVIAGDGPVRGALSAHVAALGLAARVVFTGSVPHERVHELVAVADVCFLPYPPMEDFYFSPLKMYEYMAGGKAIVASDQGQVADVLANRESALLVEPGNVRQLADATIHLIENPDLRRRLGTAARPIATSRSWRRYACELEGLYESAATT